MNNPNIAVVDYNVGNIRSVLNAIKSLGYKKVNVTSKLTELKQADLLILPGVGAFDQCIKNLRKLELDLILNEVVVSNKKPILGICVGMQIMATFSEENGVHEGLNWIPGEVKKIIAEPIFKVPHVGWNEVDFKNKNILFSRISYEPNFYFDHSYHYCCDKKYEIAQCKYGTDITAAIAKDNIFGVQFHPEKSHNTGLRLIKGFLEQ